MTRRTVESIAASVARDCLATRTRSVSRTITRLYDHALREHGVTVGQYALLTGIALNESIQPTDLGRRLNLDKSTLSRNLRVMVLQGWIAGRRSSSGRGSKLTLTARGRRVLEKAFPAWERAQKLAYAELGRLATLLSGITPRGRR